ncbi:MAG: hypothetical protein LBR18_06430 [Tannerella sp.]|jgi:hypothetical protein|nr:hypothetical protein [Tannerella sp.]
MDIFKHFRLKNTLLLRPEYNATKSCGDLQVDNVFTINKVNLTYFNGMRRKSLIPSVLTNKPHRNRHAYVWFSSLLFLLLTCFAAGVRAQTLVTTYSQLATAIASSDASIVIDGSGGPISATTRIVIGYTVTITGINNAILDGGNATQIFRIVSGGNVTIEDVTFQNGNGFDGSSPDDGGAIVNAAGGIITLNRCTFKDNATIDGRYGGALSNYTGATMTVNNCTFTGNVATGYPGGQWPHGGAINNYQGTLIVNNCEFSNNSATYLGHGGAIANNDGGVGTNATITVNNCKFANNTAYFGGAVCSRVSSSNMNLSVISNSLFTGNQATYGAVIMCAEGGAPDNFKIVNCTITKDNIADANGNVFAYWWHNGTPGIPTSTDPKFINCIIEEAPGGNWFFDYDPLSGATKDNVRFSNCLSEYMAADMGAT